MTSLFTEKDVMHLRELGWSSIGANNPKPFLAEEFEVEMRELGCPSALAKKITLYCAEQNMVDLRELGWSRIDAMKTKAYLAAEDDGLLDDLYMMERMYIYERGKVETVGMVKDIRQSAKDAEKLNKAFRTFANRHDLVIPIYDKGGDLAIVGDAINRMHALASSISMHSKRKHDPEINAPKSAVKELNRLWARDNGEPPTIEQGAGNLPAGLCFSYVLDKLTEAHGGKLGNAALREVLKQSRKEYRASQKRDVSK